jgi:hypothetical protein
MKKILLYILYIFSIIIGIDILLYLFLSPSISLLTLVVLVSMYVVLIILYLKLSTANSKRLKRLVAIKLIIVMFYVFGVFIIGNIANNKEVALWFKANVKLKNIRNAIIKYHDTNHQIPKSLAAICNDKCLKDPFQSDGDFRLSIINPTKLLIYSVGPDRIDNNGTLALSDDAIKYSSKVSPWPLTPFRKLIIKLSGFDKKIEGDIVQIINL